jgi:hypothetical protein
VGPRVKGHAFRSVMTSARNLRGDPFVDRAVQRVPEATQRMLPAVVVGGWYPTAAYRDLLGALRDEAGSTEIVREIGRACTDADVGSVWRVVIKLVSPESVLAGSGRYFSNIYSQGAVTIVDRRRGHAIASWDGCAGFGALMWEEIVASSGRLLELAGAQDVRLHVLSGGGDDEPSMRLEAWWT